MYQQVVAVFKCGGAGAGAGGLLNVYTLTHCSCATCLGKFRSLQEAAAVWETTTTHFKRPESTSLAGGVYFNLINQKQKKIQCIEAALPLQGGYIDSTQRTSAVYTEG